MCDSLSMESESSSTENSSVLDQEKLEDENDIKDDEDFEDDNLDDDSASAEEVIMLYEKIESLQYQNEINIQRSHTLELEDEKKRKELCDKEK